MHVKIVEVEDAEHHFWGKFAVCRFDNEWRRKALVPVDTGDPEDISKAERECCYQGTGWICEGPREHECTCHRHRKQSLLRVLGWGREHLLVVDLSVGHGIMVAARLSSLAKADLTKQQVYMCPMAEPFLTWLYQQDLADLGKLPDSVILRQS